MLSLITYLSALLALVPFLRPDDPARSVLLWPLKLLSGAMTPILGLLCGMGTLLGLVQRDWKLAGAGTLGLGLVVRFLRDVATSPGRSGAGLGSGLHEPPTDRQIPGLAAHSTPTRWASPTINSAIVRVHRNIGYGPNPPGEPPPSGTSNGRRFLAQRRPARIGSQLADIWEPEGGAYRSGLGVVYVHGGGWRIGDKDMGTRPFFRRLTVQGHVIMDIGYGLWPEADIPTMVGEVKRAVLWLKKHSNTYHVDPERIVLVGGSAGAHLALLAAYTSGHAALPPDRMDGDTSVRGVVAFYPPIDLLGLWKLNQATFAREESSGPQGLIERTAEKMLDWTFALPDPELGSDIRFRNFLTTILGGDPGMSAETYRLLSPNSHIGPHCPPTLLLQGCDDVFQLAPAVRELHQDLQAAGVPSALVEYPHAEHAFDLVLPLVSPLAKAATLEVERFLTFLG